MAPSNTVLITDDDEYVRRGVARLLRHHGYHVLCAGSGVEALELVAAAPPALVLLDVMMPGMDGFEVARRLRALHGDACPTIAIMSAGPFGDIDKQGVGAVAFLRKPFTSDKLLALVAASIPLSLTTARGYNAAPCVGTAGRDVETEPPN